MQISTNSIIPVIKQKSISLFLNCQTSLTPLGLLWFPTPGEHQCQAEANWGMERQRYPQATTSTIRIWQLNKHKPQETSSKMFWRWESVHWKHTNTVCFVRENQHLQPLIKCVTTRIKSVWRDLISRRNQTKIRYTQPHVIFTVTLKNIICVKLFLHTPHSFERN